MATARKSVQAVSPTCNPACEKIVKIYTDKDIGASIGISTGKYTSVGGYRYANVFVRFTQDTVSEAPVDLGLIFAFDAQGSMGARRFVNMEENPTSPQSTQFIEVSGAGSWHGSQTKISSYAARFPVMGPYLQTFVYNREPKARKVSVWVYLVS